MRKLMSLTVLFGLLGSGVAMAAPRYESGAREPRAAIVARDHRIERRDNRIERRDGRLERRDGRIAGREVGAPRFARERNGNWARGRGQARVGGRGHARVGGRGRSGGRGRTGGGRGRR